jgi:hypothetical protein
MKIQKEKSIETLKKGNNRVINHVFYLNEEERILLLLTNREKEINRIIKTCF